MATFAVGSVVLVRFPFSDLSSSKLRPAVVLADVYRGDYLLCQITSKPYADRAAIPLHDDDFLKGSLRVTSYVRPGKLFTANQALIVRQVGMLEAAKQEAIVDSITHLLRQGLSQ